MTNWYKPPDRNNQPYDGISVEEPQNKPDSLLEYYRALVALRNANSALRTGAQEIIESPVDSNVYTYLCQDTTASFVVVLNFEDKPVTLTLDLASRSLADGHYVAMDVQSNRTFDFDG